MNQLSPKGDPAPECQPVTSSNRHVLYAKPEFEGRGTGRARWGELAIMPQGPIEARRPNDERSVKLENPKTWNVCPNRRLTALPPRFGLRASDFLRHSSFVV